MHSTTQITERTLERPQRVVGFAADVTKLEASAIIGGLWQRAAAAGLFGGGADAYSVYFDYQDRLADRYRVLVGVASDDEPGEGQEAVTLPAGPFVVFTDRGASVAVATALWTSVWTTWSERERRSFDVDFERHADDAEVQLFLGVRA